MRIRLDHKTTLDGRYHVITSPDVKGLYVTGADRAEALRELDQVLALVRNDSGEPEEVPVAIEYAKAVA